MTQERKHVKKGVDMSFKISNKFSPTNLKFINILQK